jgi:hypothetical protein
MNGVLQRVLLLGDPSLLFLKYFFVFSSNSTLEELLACVFYNFKFTSESDKYHVAEKFLLKFTVRMWNDCQPDKNNVMLEKRRKLQAARVCCFPCHVTQQAQVT